MSTDSSEFDEELETYYEIFNDVIRYMIDKVCDHFKIKHFEKLDIKMPKNCIFIINNCIEYDAHTNTFKYKDEFLNFKIYKPKFKKGNYILDIFEEVMTSRIYKNKMDWDNIGLVLKDLDDYYGLNYELDNETWIEKMARDIYKMMV